MKGTPSSTRVRLTSMQKLQARRAEGDTGREGPVAKRLASCTSGTKGRARSGCFWCCDWLGVEEGFRPQQPHSRAGAPAKHDHPARQEEGVRGMRREQGSSDTR